MQGIKTGAETLLRRGVQMPSTWCARACSRAMRISPPPAIHRDWREYSLSEAGTRMARTSASLEYHPTAPILSPESAVGAASAMSSSTLGTTAGIGGRVRGEAIFFLLISPEILTLIGSTPWGHKTSPGHEPMIKGAPPRALRGCLGTQRGGNGCDHPVSAADADSVGRGLLPLDCNALCDAPEAQRRGRREGSRCSPWSSRVGASILDHHHPSAFSIHPFIPQSSRSLHASVPSPLPTLDPCLVCHASANLMPRALSPISSSTCSLACFRPHLS